MSQPSDITILKVTREEREVLTAHVPNVCTTSRTDNKQNDLTFSLKQIHTASCKQLEVHKRSYENVALMLQNCKAPSLNPARDNI